jgi:hypothetical protein
MNKNHLATLFCFSVIAPTCAFAQTSPASAPSPVPSQNPDTSLIDAQTANPAATAQSPSSNGNLPINPRNPQMPPTVDAKAPADATSPVIANISAEQTFTTLDSSHKGYLSPADVASHKYLSGHFAQCDGNRDGRLTQEEVGACLKQASPDMR